MGKHKHRHHGGGHPGQPDNQVDAEKLASVLGGGEAPADAGDEAEDTDTPDDTVRVDQEASASADAPNGEGETSNAENKETPANTEAPGAEAPAPTPVAEVPVKPVTSQPVDLEQKAKPKIVTVLRKTQPSQARVAEVKKINDETSEDLHLHTQAGRKLIGMFDEYKTLCADADKLTEGSTAQRTAVQKCARKLYDIMVMCCPTRVNPNAGVYQELIRIVFKRLSQGYGTIFSDAKIFRADYSLPSPHDSMRFDTFFSVMMQLVNAAKNGARISFNNNAVSKVLNSPNAMAIILQLRRRIENK